MLQPLCTGDLNFCHSIFPIFYLNLGYMSDVQNPTEHAQGCQTGSSLFNQTVHVVKYPWNVCTLCSYNVYNNHLNY